MQCHLWCFFERLYSMMIPLSTSAYSNTLSNNFIRLLKYEFSFYEFMLNYLCILYLKIFLYLSSHWTWVNWSICLIEVVFWRHKPWMLFSYVYFFTEVLYIFVNGTQVNRSDLPLANKSPEFTSCQLSKHHSLLEMASTWQMTPS